MKIKITIIILLTSITSYAQQNIYGINFNLGVSKITNPLTEDFDENFKNKIGLSGNVGVYYNHYFNTKSIP